jgi:hypothetical protein
MQGTFRELSQGTFSFALHCTLLGLSAVVKQGAGVEHPGNIQGIIVIINMLMPAPVIVSHI